MRRLYLAAALNGIPRLLGATDRNPYRATFGSMAREYWHYRTSPFPSEMYQEGALALAYAYVMEPPLDGSITNPWYGQERVKELAIAAIRFAARSCHADGSCDDYYPFERALGAAVFSLQATTQAYRLLGLEDDTLIDWFRRRSRWIIEHDESGRLTNHHALAALGLLRTALITGEHRWFDAARQRIEQVLGWQNAEGWFDEYGGADPGYQTVTVDALAKCRAMDDTLVHIDVPLQRAVRFCRCFLHPDDSYGGHYGSRGTYHFYPHGMELLAPKVSAAAELAEAFLRSRTRGTQAYFDDDRLVAHRLTNYFEAYRDWAPAPDGTPGSSEATLPLSLPEAGIYFHRQQTRQALTIVSTARGGIVKHFDRGRLLLSDAGLILETSDGRIAVSQQHDRSVTPDTADRMGVTVRRRLTWQPFETITVTKQILLHAFMLLVGRFCRTLVRKLLQRRLITGKRPCPISLRREIQWPCCDGAPLQITDTIRLESPTVRIRRMHFGSDHQSAYVAATNIYQASCLRPWLDVSMYVETLNTARELTIVREVTQDGVTCEVAPAERATRDR